MNKVYKKYNFFYTQLEHDGHYNFSLKTWIFSGSGGCTNTAVPAVNRLYNALLLPIIPTQTHDQCIIVIVLTHSTIFCTTFCHGLMCMKPDLSELIDSVINLFNFNAFLLPKYPTRTHDQCIKSFKGTIASIS